jgi:hypothetical protein
MPMQKKKKIAYKTVSRFSIWHEWYDVVEEEMLEFLGLIVNMGVINLPYVKDYWSQQFVYRVPFFGEVFTRKCFLQLFGCCIWRQFPLLITV